MASKDLLPDSCFTGKNDLLNFSHDKLKALLQVFEDVCQEELPSGLPPIRDVDQEIIADESTKPPHRLLYQLSPSELISTKNYVQDLLSKGKIRSRKSSYGDPLLFVKDNGKHVRSVVDYKGLNRINKRNNAPLPRSDEIFDIFGDARLFSKMDLKTGFHRSEIYE